MNFSVPRCGSSHVRVGPMDHLAIQLQDKAEHTVRSRVLRAEVDRVSARVDIGHGPFRHERSYRAVQPPSAITSRSAIILHEVLRGEFEKVKLSLEPISLEDLSKVWTALTMPFRVGGGVSRVGGADREPAAARLPTPRRRAAAGRPAHHRRAVQSAVDRTALRSLANGSARHRRSRFRLRPSATR